MAALAGGIAALVLGVIGIILWWGQFVELLMGGVPVMLILGGALAAYLGFEEVRDKRAAASFEETPGNLKQEVESLKEEIKELKEEKKEEAPEEKEEKENDSKK